MLARIGVLLLMGGLIGCSVVWSAEDGRNMFDLNEALASGPEAASGSAGLAAGPPSARNRSRKPDWIEVLFKKKPYSEYWSAEKKWEDIFARFLAVSETGSSSFLRALVKNLETYADIAVSARCAQDIRWTQQYQKRSSNFRWAIHMADSSGHTEPGMLAGNLANLGHVIQCVKVRAPAVANNDSFEERFFEQQTRSYGERFRGKYCLASIRAVMPERPRLVSRFSDILDARRLSNISYSGESAQSLKGRLKQLAVPSSLQSLMQQRRTHKRLDALPFESELFQFLISQRNFMYSLPRMLGVCFPSTCTHNDIRQILQKFFDDQHQVVDLEFQCESEPLSSWSWFNTPRLVVHVLLALVVALTLGASVARYILVDKLAMKRRLAAGGPLRAFIGALDLMSMDKCAGILLLKMKPASTQLDPSKPENRRSTSIDALRGLLVLALVYSQLLHLGCLPLPFMWAKWGDAMFPFFRSLSAQPFLNVSLWSEAFYMISAYLIGAKLLHNHAPNSARPHLPLYLARRYVRLLLPMVAFIMLNYVWPRLSNGWVMQDQAAKLLGPCDAHGWTNLLMFHNHQPMNETCLWPSHVSASFFQLHLISYPILLLLLYSLNTALDSSLKVRRKLLHLALSHSGLVLLLALALLGLLYPAYQASQQQLVVPFLIDYIDYHNYQRVIEWTVMPTHNHLTSYMLGLLLAYLVVKRTQQQHQASQDSSSDQYLHMHSSLESVLASSTHQLHLRPSFKTTTIQVNSAATAPSGSHLGSSCSSSKHDEEAANKSSGSLLASLLATLVMFITLTASWAWTGLGQPMSTNQTFWYMFATKLLFTLTFAYLFHKHFATRRNSTSPWMITRFLVPIGRMSLTAFYVSWLVVWFDLLTSLYQWFPSHYFIIEKYNEIIFMTLVIAMFVYGAFEGVVKIHDYTRPPPTTSKTVPSNPAASTAFDSLFTPIHQNDHFHDEIEPMKASLNEQLNHNTLHHNQKSLISIEPNTAHKVTGTGNKLSSINQLNKSDHATPTDKVQPTDDAKTAAGGSWLSIADQYKLNSELRANYSFASIGLYEKAGATEDLMLDRNSSTPDSLATQKR